MAAAMTCDDVRDLAPAYVLGALEADEERLVAEHLATCPEDHSEFSELGSVVPYLGDQVPIVEPPAELRLRILAAAADDLASRTTGTQPASPKPMSLPDPSGAAISPDRTAGVAPQPGTVVSLDQARVRRRADLRVWAIGIAAVLVIAVLGGLNVVTQQQLAAARDFQARTTEALQLASLPGAQVALLQSATGSNGPSGIAVMPPTGSGRLVMSGLSATTGGHVYEAWAIAEGSAPAPVGSFTVGADGIGYFDRMPSSSGETLTVAITLESQPDPPAPTTPVISSGVTVPSGGVAS